MNDPMDIRKYTELFFRDITSLGGMFIYGILCIVLLSIGELKLALQLIMAFILITVVAVFVRSIYFRPRPKEEKYSNFLEKIDASSFPSIHAARVWAMTILLCNATNQIAFIFLGATAVLVCYSRLALKKHHMSDVIVGSLIGIAIAWLV